ncbi:hypothetical protein [Epilithonimonas hominis]|uniref:hypothetical protein n=1 Tax=Epilithonimonas hominis TaxID=420404 RepID=UPI002897FCAF|nr:hypothetical protein [Epilithonimonas hominis]
MQAKQQKYVDKRQMRSINQLDAKECLKARMTMTLIAQSIELMNDCIDELMDLGLFNENSGFLKLREEYLSLQKFFIESKMGSEKEELERLEHQRRFEKLMKNIALLNPKQLDFLIEFSENVKHKN